MSLHTSIRGAGQPVVLLHSGGMSGRQWRKLADKLEPHARVLMPDFLGCGDNPAWPEHEPFHFQRDLDAVAELLDGLAEPAHLVGHSYGGFIALLLARARPALVRSLAVYDPVAFGVLHDAHDRDGLDDLARVAANPIFLDDAVGGSDRWFNAFIDYWNGEGSWQAMPLAAREAFLRVGKKVYMEVRSLIADRSTRAELATTLPALIMSGERSPAAARRVAVQLTAALPNAISQSIAGAGHMGPITHADVVNQAIASHVFR
jgi:pimeloyl-ACP methyl ester carboxylesterase